MLRDIKVGDAEPQRVIFEMFDGAAPKTVENFLALCAGTAGMCKSDPTKPLSYKGSGFHRIIPNFMCQGGDFTAGNGTGGESIYGEKFADEAGGLALPHDVKYLLSMANAAPTRTEVSSLSPQCRRPISMASTPCSARCVHF